MGDGLGEGLTRAAIAIIVNIGTPFLIGFTIVLFIMNLIFRRYKGRSLRFDPPSCLFALMISVGGGCLALQVLSLFP